VSKPRLLVLASTYPRWAGDPEPGFVHELARRLTDRFEVCVLAPHARGAARRETLDGVEVRRYRYAPAALETLVNDGGMVGNLRRSPWKVALLPGFALMQVLAAAGLLLRRRPAVVHVHWLVPQGLTMALLGWLPGAPRWLVTSHGADLFALRGAAFTALKRLVVRRASALTVVSAPMRERLLALGAAPERIEVLSMGVDLRQRFRLDHDAARDPDEVLFVGRLVEKKGLRHLIEAMPALLRLHPAARLTVAGFGPEEPARREQVARLGLQERVAFLGPVAQADLPALYRRAAVFAAPFVEAAGGDQEGLGLVLVEAAGCGCPVVAGDVVAARDVVTEAVGELVRADDPEAFAAALARRLGRAREADAERRRSAAVAAFDWQARARRYGELLLALRG
jgi:glycosyltransferase involved in cell wall biosynthesis